jgi:hypothetical protein
MKGITERQTSTWGDEENLWFMANTRSEPTHKPIQIVKFIASAISSWIFVAGVAVEGAGRQALVIIGCGVDQTILMANPSPSA